MRGRKIPCGQRATGRHVAYQSCSYTRCAGRMEHVIAQATGTLVVEQYVAIPNSMGKAPLMLSRMHPMSVCKLHPSDCVCGLAYDAWSCVGRGRIALWKGAC